MKQFPKPLPLKKLFGPSFIILALGLGSGEIILWPYLSSNYGLGIAWGAILGITFQYFINMEIERYALVKGESVFVGFSRMWKKLPIWFIASTFIGFGLPGIISASSKVISHLVGIDDHRWIAIALLVIIGIILGSGKTVYFIMEKITKLIILLGVPIILILVIILSENTDWLSLAHGLVGIGDNYILFPEGIIFVTFLSAFAYAGAGGNLNLTQSIYIKEKGYGMGKYAQKLTGLFHGFDKTSVTKLEGEEFELNDLSISRFKIWWRLISIEHAIVFWFVGGLSILLLMLLSFITVYGTPGSEQGINFVLLEGLAIGKMLWPWVGVLFLIIVAIMLFQTQLGVMDSTSRIMAENLALIKKNGKLANYYAFFVWSQIVFGIILLLAGISEPKTLIILGACINAVAMTIHIAITFFLNKSLAKQLQASLFRKALLCFIFLFFASFSIFVILQYLI